MPFRESIINVRETIVTSVYDGKESLHHALSGNYDLIILDIMMPFLSGIDVCKEIRKVSKIPIIMLTAKGEEIDVLTELKISMNDNGPKPTRSRAIAQLLFIQMIYQIIPMP